MQGVPQQVLTKFVFGWFGLSSLVFCFFTGFCDSNDLLAYIWTAELLISEYINIFQETEKYKLSIMNKQSNMLKILRTLYHKE